MVLQQINNSLFWKTWNMPWGRMHASCTNELYWSANIWTKSWEKLKQSAACGRRLLAPYKLENHHIRFNLDQNPAWILGRDDINKSDFLNFNAAAFQKYYIKVLRVSILYRQSGCGSSISWEWSNILNWPTPLATVNNHFRGKSLILLK